MKAFRGVTIVGAGALGGAYAAMMEDACPGTVRLIASGERRSRLQAGLEVNGKRYLLPVDEPGDAHTADLLIVGVKGYHLDQAIADMAGAVGDHTVILSILNGIESEDALAAAFGRHRVPFCVAVGIDAVREQGVIRYAARGRLLFGEATNTAPSPSLGHLRVFLDSLGIPCEIPVDMRRTLWWKFMINVGINQLSALLRAPYGVFHTSEEARGLLIETMREVVSVAKAQSIPLEEDDIGRFLEVLQTLHPTGKTSMLQDIEAGRSTEVELFGGTLVKHAARARVAVPINSTILRLLRALEKRTASGG